MSSGFQFNARNPNQQGFGNPSFLAPTSTTAGLGQSNLFTGLSVPNTAATTNVFGVGSTQSMFSSNPAPMGTSSWLSQPAPTFALSTAPSLFSGTNTTVATGTTPSTGLLSNFGTTATSLGLPIASTGFPSAISSVPTFGALQTMSTVPALNFTTTSGQSVVGLGGVDFSQVSTSTTGAGTSGKSDSKVLKETVLPDLLKVDVDSFRNHVKQQKTIREEISRISSKPIYRVQEETAALKQLLSVASNGVQRNVVAIEKLKAESARELKNAEVSQRTKDLPPSIQYENTAPIKYFQEVVVNFEGQMQAYRKQIEDLENHLASLSQPANLMPNELNVIVRRLHETFVALAAQLQLVHEAVQLTISVKAAKEDFIHFRRAILGDSSNVFEDNKQAKTQGTFTKTTTALGPAPFSSTPSVAAAAMLTALNRTQPAGASNTRAGTSQLSGLGSTSLMSGSSFSGQPMSSLGGFGTSSFKPLVGSTFSQPFGTSTNLSLGESAYSVQNAAFQLQKPPLGNKRGKRWTSS